MANIFVFLIYEPESHAQLNTTTSTTAELVLLWSCILQQQFIANILFLLKQNFIINLEQQGHSLTTIFPTFKNCLFFTESITWSRKHYQYKVLYLTWKQLSLTWEQFVFRLCCCMKENEPKIIHFHFLRACYSFMIFTDTDSLMT